MANPFKTIKISPAASKQSKFDMKSTHMTTMGFGQICPVWNAETLPGDKWNMNRINVFSRMSPLFVPTFGNASLKLANFFVPYHQVAEDFPAYVQGQALYQGQTPNPRFIQMKELCSLFDPANSPEYVTDVTVDDAYDWHYVDSTGASKYVRLTATGKYVYKILRMLGYQLPGAYDFSKTQSSYAANVKLNALPLLCMAKAYADWMTPSSRFNESPLVGLLLNIRQNKSVSNKYSAGEVKFGGLKTIFENLLLPYDNDYFGSAWQNINAVINSQGLSGDTSTIFVPKAHTDSAGRSISDSSINVDIFNTHMATSEQFISQRSLDFLRAFDRFVRRNNYAGTRDAEKVFAAFGIKSDNYKTHYAHLLSIDSIDLQVGDVTSTAQTDGATLGDYAGKGIISGGSKFDVEVTDYGHIITLAWLAVEPVYPTGIDRAVLRFKPFDFYTPDFDAVGPQAIAVGEVAMNPKDNSAEHAVDFLPFTETYGFTERYNEYRVPPRDRITGDMELFEDFKCWHFGRELTTALNAGKVRAQEPQMLYQPQTGSEYNRIFQVTDGIEDPFFVSMFFDCDAYRRMKNLNEVVNLGDGSLTVAKNGAVLS